MHTESEPEAAAAASAEAATWAQIGEGWSPQAQPEAWETLPPTEGAVIPQADPSADLARRGGEWGFEFSVGGLDELARFAAGLAAAEAGAWRAGDGSVSTRALSDRRFLMADRILPWAVPWLDAVDIAEAGSSHALLLELGDRHRPAPALVEGEGLALPGEDGYGPVEFGPTAKRLASLWGGLVPDNAAGRPSAERYDAGALRWRALADAHPGTARCWLDLAARATRTAELMRPIAP